MNPDRAARLNGAVDRAHGVLMRIIPKAPVDSFGMPLATDGRLARNVVGTFIEAGPSLTFLDGDRHHKEIEGRATRQGASASFDLSLFTASDCPRKGDQLKTIFEGGAERTFNILAAEPAGVRLTLILVRA